MTTEAEDSLALTPAHNLARDWLLVSEQFTTIQGEGPTRGTPAYFVRLGACNQHCSWCDTPYTWVFTERQQEQHRGGRRYDPSTELKRLTAISIANDILTHAQPLTVFTGGEPLLQIGPLEKVIAKLNEDRWARIEIETAGTLSCDPLLAYRNVFFNVSPKLATSGNEYSLRFRPQYLKQLKNSGRAVFKFVVDTAPKPGLHERVRGDLTEIETIVNRIEIDPRNVYLMPQGVTEAEVVTGMRMLVPEAMQRGWNVTGRDHVLLWGDQRGR